MLMVPQTARTMLHVILLIVLTRPYLKRTLPIMNTCQRTQRGGSAIVPIIILAIIGFGAYIGIQYFPQYIESSTVDSILSSIEKANANAPLNGVKGIQDIIDKQLNVNDMNDLKDNFKVKQDGEVYTVKVSYTRELNLIYTKKAVEYEKSITLK